MKKNRINKKSIKFDLNINTITKVEENSIDQKFQQYKFNNEKHDQIQTINLGQETQNQINKNIYTRFEGFLQKQKLKKLKYAMDNYIGRNTPINYHHQFGFLEQWENKKKFFAFTLSDFMHTHNFYIQLLALIILVGYVIVVWFISYQIVFQHFELFYSAIFYCIGLLVTFVHLILKLKLNSKFLQHDAGYFYYIRYYILDFMIVSYFIFIISVSDKQWIQSDWIIFFHVFFIINGYKKGADIYKSFKMKIITSIYKDLFNLFDLLATSLIVAHIFALILFLSATLTDQSSSWLQNAELKDEDPKVQYVYSFYFACTTMLTVGYGDLTPSNVVEIIAVLLIQIFGIAIFAYVINQIGHTLSSMRKQQESLQKDLSSLSKISKYYGLDQELQTKARAYIIDNQTQINELLPQEQKQLLMKLNDQLRTQINQENSLKIIKSSVFFICHWSKKMQFEIAKKLIKKLFSPNERLFQNPGRQSIYVIKRGKVEIYTDKYSGLKRHFKKLLKTIQTGNQQDVSNNVYGYTSVISNKAIHLNAITKDFTVVYYIQKNDFIESIMDHELDFQYYHEIKVKIDMQQLPEAYEAPSILNIRQHYRPNVFFVIKKHKKHVIKNKRTSQIRDQNRSNKRRLKVQCYSGLQQLQGDVDFIVAKSIVSSRGGEYNFTKTKTMQMTDPASTAFLVEQSECRRNLNENFDSCKEYENYFKRFNYSNVLLKSERQNYNQTIVKAKLSTMRSIKTLRNIKLAQTSKSIYNSEDDQSQRKNIKISRKMKKNILRRNKQQQQRQQLI